MAAKIHLDPWTDIVGVGWGKITHVAFEVRVGDGGWTQTSYDYPSGIGFFTTSISTGAQKVVLQTTRYILRRSGTTKTWTAASPAVVAVSGFPDTGGVKTISNSWGECSYWEPIPGAGGPPAFISGGRMLGFDSRRAGGVDIPVPAGGGNFDSGLDSRLVYWTNPLTACTGGVNATTTNLSAIEEVVIGASVLGGVSVTYKGLPCTIAGTWTPANALTPNVAITAVEVPKRLVILASIDGVSFP
jgi:hypothetical protein